VDVLVLALLHVKVHVPQVQLVQQVVLEGVVTLVGQLVLMVVVVDVVILVIRLVLMDVVVDVVILVVQPVLMDVLLHAIMVAVICVRTLVVPAVEQDVIQWQE
jgi:hypothetical protein